ncbi:Ca-activated chloride channel family protein [Nonlabens dokdonensis]|jgi:Ca-activated chloride channel family protein|uniref:von Willebrand factor type A domain protein n=2 Tax=Nonlabens dokdonensis TaxID=328515 RepID=L7W5J8_NONDD|nr:von Willebrand factor type A domain-containing protein [Nonlabens dokdonensis]AGC75354.1 von Willebrand factor type A domain protein [Nonlabens dokdonensis DSW-6]PZX43058.1 Ca-activated chloride channel family protein [Nonlabens dokdonensis]
MKKSIFIVFITAVFLSCDTDGTMSSLNAGFDNEFQGNQYNDTGENPFILTSEEAISTFSIDADGGSYANSRRILQTENRIPIANAIRIEEFINYFDMQYDDDSSTRPITLNGEVTSCPWNTDHRLARIGVKGRDIDLDNAPATNYVFLIDVSGSMSSVNKLDILKQGFELLTDQLTANDRISIVTYAGSNSVVLSGVSGDQHTTIKNAIQYLGSGGGTAGASGIITAYEIAQNNFIPNGNNRIILGTDGDFNIGISDQDSLISLIEDKRESGVYLTVLGVGYGNLNEGTLEQIANKGNGTYEYIDKVAQLEKVFIHERNKFYTAAKDVKIQIEFSPDEVESYRLIGYENRILGTEDFNDDTEDAGEIGRGQSITALYEIVPSSTASNQALPSLKVNARYKEATGTSSNLLIHEIIDENLSFDLGTDAHRFSAGIAAFTLVMRDSQYRGNATYLMSSSLLQQASMNDPHGYKSELEQLVQLASGF